MTAFERAFALLKGDTGMWDEIYAPILAETAGMGDKQRALNTIDFAPTDFAMDNLMALRPQSGDNWNYMHSSKERGGDGLNTDENWKAHLMTDTGDHGHNVEQLIESILEHGYDLRGAERSRRIDPSFEFSREGIDQYEGRHRILALDKLGAPYVPYMGFHNRYADKRPHSMPLGADFTADVMNNRNQYSLGGYLGTKARLAVPPSYLYGREMVPGMGRLSPVDMHGKPLDMQSHIHDVGPQHQAWYDQQSWDVIHDD